MLRITASESAEATKQYAERALMRGDYYFERQEMARSWGGKGAERLGLTGKVTKDALMKLLDNKRPNGRRLAHAESPSSALLRHRAPHLFRNPFCKHALGAV